MPQSKQADPIMELMSGRDEEGPCAHCTIAEMELMKWQNGRSGQGSMAMQQSFIVASSVHGPRHGPRLMAHVWPMMMTHGPPAFFSPSTGTRWTGSWRVGININSRTRGRKACQISHSPLLL